MLKRIEEINANPRTRELAEFIIIGIRGKLLRMKRKRDGVEGMLAVQGWPRL